MWRTSLSALNSSLSQSVAGPQGLERDSETCLVIERPVHDPVGATPNLILDGEAGMLKGRKRHGSTSHLTSQGDAAKKHCAWLQLEVGSIGQPESGRYTRAPVTGSQGFQPKPLDSGESHIRLGVDENGLGARLGPLLVTAAVARVDERGERALRRKLPKRIAADLDDSKRLLRHGSVGLGEAWARALHPTARSPEELLRALALEDQAQLEAPCPKPGVGQCWRSTQREFFESSDKDVARIQKHLAALGDRGIEVVAVRSSVVCTKRLNESKAKGHNRFIRDLHAMEELILSFHEELGCELHCVCGKVGGIGDYTKFFGPLSGRLHAVLNQERAHSGYKFPGLGELHFVKDADAADPLVMLASLVGKYLRELLMARIGSYYGAEPDGDVPVSSGYNDPITNRFVLATEQLRAKRRIPSVCFEREGADVERGPVSSRRSKRGASPSE